MGVPFAKRGKRMDECIDIIRGLTTGEYFEYHGEFYDIPKTKMTPAPTEPIPILIGGHADAALRRAARNDGWMHGGGDGEELDRLLAKLNRDPRGGGRRADEDFEVHVISIDAYTVDGVKRLEDKGVTDVHRRLPGALHQGARHRAAGRQDPQPGVVRRERHREGLALTADPTSGPASRGGPSRPPSDSW